MFIVFLERVEMFPEQQWLVPVALLAARSTCPFGSRGKGVHLQWARAKRLGKTFISSL